VTIPRRSKERLTPQGRPVDEASAKVKEAVALPNSKSRKKKPPKRVLGLPINIGTDKRFVRRDARGRSTNPTTWVCIACEGPPPGCERNSRKMGGDRGNK
jgi:hypothetical protein